MMMKAVLLFVVAAIAAGLSEAFTVNHGASSRNAPLSMAPPKFDSSSGKWTSDESISEGYGAVKTLLMHGPKPFFTRVFTPDDYEQAVFKFMASDKVTLEVAQGNMDRYLENGQDWAFERLEAEKRGRPYPAYHVLDQKSLILTLVWSAIVLVFGGRAVYTTITGDYYWTPFLQLLQ